MRLTCLYHIPTDTGAWGRDPLEALDNLKQFVRRKGYAHVPIVQADIEETVVTDTPPENSILIEVISHGNASQNS